MGGAVSSSLRGVADPRLGGNVYKDGPGGGGMLAESSGVQIPSSLSTSSHDGEEERQPTSAVAGGVEKRAPEEKDEDEEEEGKETQDETATEIIDRRPTRRTTFLHNQKRQSTEERLGKLAKGVAIFQEKTTEMDSVTSQYVTILPKGGHWLKLGDTVMQFGCPPETIKDSMQLGLDVPRYFIVLGDLFSRTKGVNYAELEFPCYFNFFIRKQRTVVLTTRSIEKRIRALFRETLLGPREEDFDISRDYPPDCSPDCFPDFKREGEWLDAARKTLTVDSLLEFKIFEPTERDATGYAHVFTVELPNEITIQYSRDEREYHVFATKVLPTEVEKLVIHMEDVIEKIEEEASSRELQKSLLERPRIALPDFGVTMLGTSHGFDPKGQTTGFVLWANRRGTMVDPPPNSLECLDALGISSRTIDSIVLTHCHSDHDAGAFRRLLFDQHITIYTTRTIFESFVRKYANVCGFSEAFLRRLLLVKFVIIGQEIFIHGAAWRFFYSLHTIPCIGFEVKFNGKSIAYSADTNQSPDLFQKMYDEGIIGKGRFESLTSFPWHADMILHEAGVPPIHTPMAELLKLPAEIKEKLYVVHVAQKDIPKDAGFNTLYQGDTRAVMVQENELNIAIEILDVLNTVDLLKEACRSFRDALDCMYLIQTESFEPGQLIVRAGDPGDRIYIITRGTAVVSWQSNGETSTKNFHVGDYFGEASLVTGEPRNADVTAHDYVTTATLSRQHFEFLIDGTDIKQRFIALSKIREKNTWQLISKNSVTRLLTSTAKTQLETAMEERAFKKGDVLWTVGMPAQMLLFVQSGAFHVKVDASYLRERRMNLSMSIDQNGRMHVAKTPTGATSRGKGSFEYGETSSSESCIPIVSKHSKSEDPMDSDIDFADSRLLEAVVTPGAFIGDFDAVFTDQPVASSVICLEDGSGLVISNEKWKEFCAKFPGGLLFFMEKHITI